MMEKINHNDQVIIYDPVWSKFFLRISPSCFITGIIASYYGYWGTCLAEVAVFVSSFMHWRDPRQGLYIWRVVDITVVHISFGVHVFVIWNCTSLNSLLTMLFAAVCFAWSLRYNSYTHHAAGWFFSCLSNLFLTYHRYTSSV